MKTCAVLASLCVLTVTTVFSGPTIKNGIIADETWTAEGSPYLIDGDILAASLTIEPGVNVQFQGKYVFEVAGYLKANGSVSSPITFSTTNLAVGWNGIFFNEAGSDSVLNYCVVEGSKQGGIRITNTALTIAHCTLVNNSNAENGGGIFASLKSGQLIVDSCTISSNSTIISGGGIYLNGQGVIKQCIINHNQASGTSANGAGIFLVGGSSIVSNCRISSNQSSYVGGGISVYANVHISNCLILTNSATGGYDGGMFVGDNGVANILNAAIVGNTPAAIFLYRSGKMNMTNSIVYNNNNGGAQIAGNNNMTLTFNDIQGFSSLNGINKNPVFNPVTLELLSGSPCIDAGSPLTNFNDVAFPPSKGTARNDMGAYGGPSAVFGIGPGLVDQDGDGLADAWEIQYFGDIKKYGANDDPDADGLLNTGESTAGTDPTKKDTDGDGFNDLTEIESGSDPLDPKSTPTPVLMLTVKQVQLDFAAGNGTTYIIQASSDLNNWLPSEQIMGEGNNVSRIYNVTNNMRYFRVVKPQ